MSRILAVIPARGGSKRLPGKNVRPLGGLPLIAWTIRAAQQAGGLARIVVTTDDPGIAAIAEAHGAEVPFLRTAALATDEATSAAVVLDLLDRLGPPEPDGVLLLQPTSPFRTAETIRRGLALFAEAGGESVVSVSPAREHPFWCKRLDAEGRLQPFIPDAPVLRSQDLPPAYALNGLLYLTTPATLRATGGFYSPATRALVVPEPAEAVDIDTPLDWALAEAVLASRGAGG